MQYPVTVSHRTLRRSIWKVGGYLARRRLTSNPPKAPAGKPGLKTLLLLLTPPLHPLHNPPRHLPKLLIPLPYSLPSCLPLPLPPLVLSPKTSTSSLSPRHTLSPSSLQKQRLPHYLTPIPLHIISQAICQSAPLPAPLANERQDCISRYARIGGRRLIIRKEEEEETKRRDGEG